MGWFVKEGREFPTDSSLLLVNPTGESKEYAIESIAWKILTLVFDREWDFWDGELAQWIWDNREEDVL